MFQINGETYTAQQMIDANSDDAELCAWISAASVGDVFPTCGERCERVA